MTMPISELEEELVTHWGIPRPKVHAWRSFLEEQCKTSGDVQVSQVSHAAMLGASEKAELSGEEVDSIKMCIGSASRPFTFPGKEDVDVKKDVNKQTKGGGMTEVAEVLTVRRPPLDAANYFPPANFDAHRVGLESRNEEQLRKACVKEVDCPPPPPPPPPPRARILTTALPSLQLEDVAGHLYPTKKEKEVVLSAIQAMCGPPNCKKLKGEPCGYFNDWVDSNHVHHKGATIGDLEKARRPETRAKYPGVTGRANNSGLRPPRPMRIVPPLQPPPQPLVVFQHPMPVQQRPAPDAAAAPPSVPHQLLQLQHVQAATAQVPPCPPPNAATPPQLQQLVHQPPQQQPPQQQPPAPDAASPSAAQQLLSLASLAQVHEQRILAALQQQPAQPPGQPPAQQQRPPASDDAGRLAESFRLEVTQDVGEAELYAQLALLEDANKKAKGDDAALKAARSAASRAKQEAKKKVTKSQRQEVPATPAQ